MASGDKTYIADKATQDKILEAVNAIKSKASRKSMNYLNEIVNKLGDDLGLYEYEADLSMLTDKTYLSPAEGGSYSSDITSYFDADNNIAYLLYELRHKGNVSGSYYYYQLYSLDLDTNKVSFRGLFRGFTGYYNPQPLASFCIYNGYMYVVPSQSTSATLYRAPIDVKTSVSTFTSLKSAFSDSSRVTNYVQLFPINRKIVMTGVYNNGYEYLIFAYDISAGTFTQYSYVFPNDSTEVLSSFNWIVGNYVYYIVTPDGVSFYLYRMSLTTGQRDQVFYRAGSYFGGSDSSGSYLNIVSLHNVGDYKLAVVENTNKDTTWFIRFDETQYYEIFNKTGLAIPTAGCNSFSTQSADTLDDSNSPIVLNKFIGIRYDDAKDKAYLQLATYNTSSGDSMKKLYIEKDSTMYTDASHMVSSDCSIVKNDGTNVFEADESGLYSFVDLTYLSVSS